MERLPASDDFTNVRRVSPPFFRSNFSEPYSILESERKVMNLKGAFSLDQGIESKRGKGLRW